MLSKRILLLSIVFISVALSGGCTSNSPSTNKILHPNIPVQKLNFPEAEYNNLFWLSQKGLVEVISNLSTGRFSLVEENSSQLHELSLPSDPACKKYLDYFPSQILPDGRIGLIKNCGEDIRSASQNTSFLMAYDLEYDKLEKIVAGNLPSWVNSRGFTWNPTMTRGVQELTDRLFSTLHWISPNGSSPIPLTLKDGYRSWSLDEQYNNMTTTNEGGSQYGYAGYPAWSPDGKTIAFWVSFDAMGHTGITRVDGEFYLVFLNPEDLSYRFVIKDIYDPYELKWSADGKWLAFFGSAGSTSEKGLWLYSLTENSLTKIGDKQHFSGAPAWFPDGQSIAVISCYAWETEICKKTEILKYDLSNVMP